MAIKTASAWALLAALLAGPAPADPLPTAGRYRCIIIGTGGCSTEPGNDSCIGTGIRRGHRRAHLSLDFSTNRATLNGLHGTILREGDGGDGAPAIAFGDLSLLGTPTIGFQTTDRLILVTLRRDTSMVEFSCRRSG